MRKDGIGEERKVKKQKTKDQKETAIFWKKIAVSFWRKVWDSNPRARKGKRFSRPPRYDHFDNLPFMLNLKDEINNQYSVVRLRLVMSCCGARKVHRIRRCSIFSTAATPYCSLHLPPAALANVPTSITFRVCFSYRNILSYRNLFVKYFWNYGTK